MYLPFASALSLSRYMTAAPYPISPTGRHSSFFPFSLFSIWYQIPNTEYWIVNTKYQTKFYQPITNPLPFTFTMKRYLWNLRTYRFNLEVYGLSTEKCKHARGGGQTLLQCQISDNNNNTPLAGNYKLQWSHCTLSSICLGKWGEGV